MWYITNMLNKNSPTNIDLTVGFASTTIGSGLNVDRDYILTNPTLYTSNNWWDQYYPDDLTMRRMRIEVEKLQATTKSKEQEMSTLDLFSNKDEDQKLLEEYEIINETGDLTKTGWIIIGKLLLADKKTTIIETLKADKEAKKNEKAS